MARKLGVLEGQRGTGESEVVWRRLPRFRSSCTAHVARREAHAQPWLAVPPASRQYRECASSTLVGEPGIPAVRHHVPGWAHCEGSSSQLTDVATSAASVASSETIGAIWLSSWPDGGTPNVRKTHRRPILLGVRGVRPRRSQCPMIRSRSWCLWLAPWRKNDGIPLGRRRRGTSPTGSHAERRSEGSGGRVYGLGTSSAGLSTKKPPGRSLKP